MKQHLCVGTYTEPILFGTGEVFQGKGRGVSICEFRDSGLRELTCLPQRNPSFLCLNEERQKIYAVNEAKTFQGEFGGGLTQLRYDGGWAMEAEKSCLTLGTDPCHVALSPDRSFVAVSNFASGSLSVFPLDPSGELTGQRLFFPHEGSSVHPVRQKGPHAHSAVFSPDGLWMFVPDLGLDRVKAYRCMPGGVCPAPEADIPVPAGSGPRFGEFSPDGKHFYLICEISSEIIHYTYEGDRLIPRETISTLPEDYGESNICSDLHITPDGRYLYASNRGHDSIVCCQIGGDGALRLLCRQPCGGKTPRNFAIDPAGAHLLVGNQDSDNITVFKINAQGALHMAFQLGWPSPVCLRFFSG